MGEEFAALGERPVEGHMAWLESRIRARPQDAGLRLALCHFLAVRGQWQRAQDVLAIVQKLDASFTPAVATCALALRGEKARAEFWAGGAAPTVIGGASAWTDDLIAAVQQSSSQPEEAARRRDAAREGAPAQPGVLVGTALGVEPRVLSGDDEPTQRIEFAWLCDGDTRLGPVFEVLTAAGYAWLPWAALRRVSLRRAQHLIDLLWAPAEFEMHDGSSSSALIPVRYPAELPALDDDTNLARQTQWLPLPGEAQYAGLGQRVLTSDVGDHPLLDLRSIEFTADITP